MSLSSSLSLFPFTTPPGSLEVTATGEAKNSSGGFLLPARAAEPHREVFCSLQSKSELREPRKSREVQIQCFLLCYKECDCASRASV